MFSLERVVTYADFLEYQAHIQALDNIRNVLYIPGARLEAIRECIFTALLWRNSPGWTVGLVILRKAFENHANQIIDITQALPNQYPQYIRPADMAYLENTVKSLSNDIHDAITKAVAGDGGAALEALACQEYAPIPDMLMERMEAFQTDHLAQDRRYYRETVYIGHRCNQLEQQGYKQIRQQWKQVYHELKTNQTTLTGDALTAWDYFQKMNPHSMTLLDTRKFEQEISRMKATMAGYTEAQKFRQSSDK